VDILRVNQKYVQELGMNVAEEHMVHSGPWETFDDENRATYIQTIERAIEAGDEQTCETRRTLSSDCCGVEHLEAIIPLTVGRVPFHVRYTTVFDENGCPLKAYGSATMVQE